jgi:hypothetical protein
VVSVALLSLGAPFWFNVLKNLSNLRPVLAKKQQEEAEEQKTGGFAGGKGQSFAPISPETQSSKLRIMAEKAA